MKWIDTHAHLDDRAFDKDRPVVLTRCARIDAGVITVGASLDSSRAAVRLAHRTRGVWAAVGVHPHDARHVDTQTLEEIRLLARDPMVVAIGEIGLDYYRDLSLRSQQREAFRAQLRIAEEMDLPVILHNRESTADLIAVLKDLSPPHRGVVHSFLGDASLAETFLRLGLHLGIGGPLTYPKNDALREAVRQTPLDRLVLETDCPYLSPVPHRGQRNEPAHLPLVAEEIARIREISVDTVAQRTTENAKRVFSLS